MNYQKYANKAYSKIKQYGSPITIQRSGSTSYNPLTDKYENNGVILSGFALQNNFDQKNIDGTNIRYGDVLLMCVLDGEPKSNDTIAFGSRGYTVVNVEVLSPDGQTDIYYKIQAR